MASLQRGNLLDALPATLPREQFEVLARWPAARIERIVSRGHTSPDQGWYDQEDDEWVAVLEGEAQLRFEDGETVDLKCGNWLLIPARKRHRVSYTSTEPACVWLAVHVANV